jgi:S-layer protein
MKSGSYVVSADSDALPTTIDGGSGNDTIDSKLITAGNGDQFVNFEYLGLNGASADASLLTGSTITGLVMLNGGGTYTGVSPAQSLTIVGDASSDTTTLSYGTTALGADDSLSITLADPNADYSTTKPTSANFNGGAVVTSGIENYNINSGGTLAWNTMTLGANTSAQTVTITGAANLDLAFASGFGDSTLPKLGVSSISGAGATGKLAINATNAVHALTGLTITGGSNDDTIITTGITSVAGGAGKDIFNVTDNQLASITATATAAEVVEELVTILDFEYGDKIQFATPTNSGAVSVEAEVDVTAATTLLEAVNLAAAAGNNGSYSEVNWFVYGGNTYLLLDDAAATTSDLDSDDTVIKVMGIHDFDNSTLSATGLFEYVA